MVHHDQEHRHGTRSPSTSGRKRPVARGGAGLLAAGEQTILFCQHDDSPSSWRMTDSCPTQLLPHHAIHPGRPGWQAARARPVTASSVVFSGPCRSPGGTPTAGSARGEGPGLLPPPVPPDPRERRVVGQGLHRVAQCHTAPVRSIPATTNPTSPASSATTTCGCPRFARPRRRWPATTDSPDSSTTTTGSTAGALLERPFDEVLATGSPDFPVRAVLGQRGVDPELGRQEWPCPHAPALWPGRRHRSPPMVGHGVRRPPLHHHRRQAALPRLPTRGPRPIRGAPRTVGGAEAQKLGFPDLYLAWVEAWGQPPGGPEANGFDATVAFMPPARERLFTPLESVRGHRVMDYVRLSRSPPGPNCPPLAPHSIGHGGLGQHGQEAEGGNRLRRCDSRELPKMARADGCLDRRCSGRGATPGHSRLERMGGG